MKKIMSVLLLMLVAMTPLTFVQAAHTDENVRHNDRTDRALDRETARATGHVVYDERIYDERVPTDRSDRAVLHDVKEDVIKDHKTDRATLEVEHDAIPQGVLDFATAYGIDNKVLSEIPGFPADFDMSKVNKNPKKLLILGDAGYTRTIVGYQYPQGNVNNINYWQGEVYFNGISQGTVLGLYKPTTINSGYFTGYFRDKNNGKGQWTMGVYGELNKQPIALLWQWGQTNTMNLYGHVTFDYK